MSGKRSIFEEVNEAQQQSAPQPATGIIDRGRGGARLALRAWLISLFVLVALMIVIGGLTRLTDSGLSITEWNVVTGVLPPLGAETWATEFSKYQQICEFTQQNTQMTLAEFKTIYWWEWGHRQLGRLVGLVWAAGFLFFLLTKRMPAGWTGRTLALGVLGGLQGGIGWWMVSSGVFECRVDVSSLRLAVHLGLAFLILGVISWFVLALSRPERELMQARRAREPRLSAHGSTLIVVLFVQILLGALVAGIDAGRNYTDWPLMAGAFLPPDMWQIEPVWRNLIENDGTVQFIHRIWGYLLFALGLRVWWVSRRSSYTATKRAFDWATVILFGQIVIGIVTVMQSAPLGLAILHQAMAILLWVLVVRARHRAQFPVAQSLRDA